ncbi:GNAT family N-acetyltransferase [Nitratireductor indicus]|uniref:GNAT family N-acetyltransferase n=1 Tax=Nitratireductor indicus TaxID=721133 RepID=UPI002876E2A3|nr:GNAT family N-acetyltransferase [Nitratireductor indicus]MDS1134922.1 GNAT family N-acetyltransferase [Nitratireductor indicus]
MERRAQEGADSLVIREARESDVPAIVALFASDALGGHGDTTDPAAYDDYLAAFRRIAASAGDTLYVAELDAQVVGTFQTTFITSMTGRGSTSMTIEAVQTREDMRGKGIGATMITYAVEVARTSGARLVQLMSNAQRDRAHHFYERLGFARSHVGFKMKLK